jgi:hypothetical protein
MRRGEFITLVGRYRGGRSRAAYPQPPARAASFDSSILRIDLERDPVASGLGVAVVSKPS